jgi:hypothetical protein
VPSLLTRRKLSAGKHIEAISHRRATIVAADLTQSLIDRRLDRVYVQLSPGSL